MLLSKVYTVDAKKTGKFGAPADYGPAINETILGGYDKFIRDPQVREIFAASQAEAAPG